MVSATNRYARRSLAPSPEVHFQEVDGECILLDLGSGLYFGLNAAGTRVWTLLAEGKQFEAIAATLEREFDAPWDVIERDLVALLQELESKGLVT